LGFSGEEVVAEGKGEGSSGLKEVSTKERGGIRENGGTGEKDGFSNECGKRKTAQGRGWVSTGLLRKRDRKILEPRLLVV